MKNTILGRVLDEAPRFDLAWRRQVRRQIYLPLAIGFLLLLAFIVGLLWGGEGKTRLWGDLALIYLTAAAGVVGLLFLAIVAGLAYGVAWLTGHIPQPARRVRVLAARVRTASRRAANGAATPVIRTKALWASLRAISGTVRRGFRRL